MTCDHCCGADRFFDLESAKKEMKKYKRNGPKKSTKLLISSLDIYDKDNKTLLDIGGGIGSIQWDFLKHHDTKTTHVDASGGYLNIAKSFAIEMQYEARAKFIKDDIVDAAPQIDEHDFVTMDKVICCYPEYKVLLENALSKCKSVFALSYPLGGPIANLFRGLASVYLYFIKNPFRPYVHPTTKVRSFIEQQGFDMTHHRISFPWIIQTYQRI